MIDNAEPRPPLRRISHARPAGSILPAILIGGAIGGCVLIGFAAWVGLSGSNRAEMAWPTALVVTATPTPVVPTPTPTSTPTPLPTPDRLTLGGYAQVSGTGGDALRLRSDPGLQTTTLETVPEGTRLLILDGPRDADNLTWWRLRNPASGAEGWAAQLYLAPSGPP